ncbi:MAG: hypothetical protein ACK5YH_15270 [Pseudanabaena sp.]|nr:hypothetical protein [Pseudanabaena sp. M007S1SP1A06QC]
MFKIKQRAPFTTTNLIAYFPIKQRSPLNTHKCDRHSLKSNSDRHSTPIQPDRLNLKSNSDRLT